MSGSAAIRFRKVRHRLLAVEHAFVHVDVDDLRAALDLLRATATASSYLPSRISLANLARAGDVGALADLDEVALGPERQRSHCRVAGASGGSERGGAARLASPWRPQWRVMCSGVVPQQPPTMFSQPLRRKIPHARHHLAAFRRTRPARSAARRWDNSSHKRRDARHSSMCGRICSGPRRSSAPRSACRNVRHRIPKRLDRLHRRVRPRRTSCTDAITGRRTP